MAKRPLGVTVIAVADLIVAPFLLVAGVKALISTVREWGSVLLLGREGLLLALDFCVLVVGAVCAVGAADLWRLRKRGRMVTIFLMCIFGVFAADFALLGSTGEFPREALWAGSASFVFCVWAAVYLCLPSIRRKFEAATASKSSPLS